MRRFSRWRALLVATILSASAQAEDPAMLETMSRLQTLTHKLQLSLDQANQPLANFYVEELGGAVEDLSAIESYAGYPISDLTRTMLTPSYQLLAKAVAEGRGRSASDKLERLIGACNSCHQVTEHGFIRIQPNRSNPYLQSFLP